jgi:hypothetical protein
MDHMQVARFLDRMFLSSAPDCGGQRAPILV